MEQRFQPQGRPLVRRMALGGLFLALGVLFPFLFHLLPAGSGEIFLPMHIPVILAGMVLGPSLGTAVGVLTPVLNTLISSMPPPARLPYMMVELAAYAFTAGLCRCKFRLPVPASLILTQLAGRGAYGLSLFIAGWLLHIPGAAPIAVVAASIKGWPGVLVQWVFIPLLLAALKKGGIRFERD